MKRHKWTPDGNRKRTWWCSECGMWKMIRTQQTGHITTRGSVWRTSEVTIFERPSGKRVKAGFCPGKQVTP